MYTLYIGNKNYSSWSLRPWVLMRALGIAFTERLIAFGPQPAGQSIAEITVSGRVPCLKDDELWVWDSLAIVEYLAERHTGVWPSSPVARAWARCASAEMHSSFQALRGHCGMSCGQRVALNVMPPGVTADLQRIGRLWEEGLTRFGGPYLAGPQFTAVDAFFAPVAFRIQTYGLPMGRVAADYAARLLAHPAMREWYTAGLAEVWRDPPHEQELLANGRVLEDLRA